MTRLTALLAALFVATIVAGTAGSGNPPWGQDPCSHGSTGKDCRPDPQPEHGKDCDHHGNNGGVNEDHCGPATPPPTTPPPPCTHNCTTPPPPPVTPPPPPAPPRCPPGMTPTAGKDGKPGNDECETPKTPAPPVTTTTPSPVVTPPVVTPPAATPPAPPAAQPKPDKPKAKPPVKKATSKVKPPVKKKAVVKPKPKLPPVCPVGKPFKGKCAVMGSG